MAFVCGVKVEVSLGRWKMVSDEGKREPGRCIIIEVVSQARMSIRGIISGQGERVEVNIATEMERVFSRRDSTFLVLGFKQHAGSFVSKIERTGVGCFQAVHESGGSQGFKFFDQEMK